MNQDQINLIKKITDKMTDPFHEFLFNDENADIVNQDGGEFAAIMVSILSSVMATTLNAWVNLVEEDLKEKQQTFDMFWLLITKQAKDARDNHTTKPKGVFH